jgi:glycosyltransferase involved in cell wall biosynthesis
MKTLVSITPIRVEADSRTFKQAASVARFGYKSIVVEGEPSGCGVTGLPFELRTIAPVDSVRTTAPYSAEGAHPVATPKGRRLFRGLRQLLKATPLGPRIKFARFVANYLYLNGIRPLRSVPAASLYYLHAPLQFPAVYLLCKRHRARFVYDAHDFYSRMKERAELPTVLDQWVQDFYRRIESLCVKNAAAVVTVNDGIAALQREAFGCSPIVLRNCHDDRLDRKPQQNLREVLGLSSEIFLLVNIGQAKEGRAFQEALAALLGLPNSVHLAFVGRHYEQYQDMIRESGFEERVHLIPPVKPYEVVPFIQSADASLIMYYPRTPAYLYSLPNSFFQSIAAELPLLYPELPEIKRVAEEYRLGIPIDPQDPCSIRSAVLELTSDTARTTDYRKNLQRAKQELSWEREEVVLRDLLTDVLKR